MPGIHTRTILALVTAGLSIAAARAASPPLVVHEWGTFTSFQDDQGRTIQGINVDDEPVPRFVHRLRDFQTFRTTAMPAIWSQGAPRCYPGVTLRLETPVLYFYPPVGWQATPFDVRATFNGGWLTEFYPSAATEGMNVQKVVDGDTRGSLLWRQVRLDPNAASLKPKTNSHVWLAPREVRSTVIVNDATREAEKYLFYRGVGNLDAPIVVRGEGGKLHISLRDNETGLERLPRLWVVEVLPDKRVRYQTAGAEGPYRCRAGISHGLGQAGEPPRLFESGTVRRAHQRRPLRRRSRGHARHLATVLLRERRVARVLPVAAILDRWAPAAVHFHAGGYHPRHGGPRRAGHVTPARGPAEAGRPARQGVRRDAAVSRTGSRSCIACCRKAAERMPKSTGRPGAKFLRLCSSTNRSVVSAMPCWRMNGRTNPIRHAARDSNT